jgi:hypothetical protein
MTAHRVRFEIAGTDEHAEEYPGDVGVENCRALTERKTQDGAGGVCADALERPERCFVAREFAAVPFDRLAGDRVQSARTDVVAERTPCRRDVRFRRGRKRLERRVLLEPLVILGQHAIDLRLLKHHLGYQDAVRVARLSPGQVPAVASIPIEKPPSELLPRSRRRQCWRCSDSTRSQLRCRHGAAIASTNVRAWGNFSV